MRNTRAAVAAQLQLESEMAASVELPASPNPNTDDFSAFRKSTSSSRRIMSGHKDQIIIAQDEIIEEAFRPGSPPLDFSASTLKPKSQANQLLAKEKLGVRSTSNKENMQPTDPVHHGMSSPGGNTVSTGRLDESAVIATEEAVACGNNLQLPTPESQMVSGPEEAPVQKTINRRLSSKPPRPSLASDRRASSMRSIKSADPRVSSSQVIIPHSKPRPMSMSFPSPPPPPKSTRPPTRPTFQLPGEAVAARLKAAKEERMKRDENPPVKKPAFKARPAPSMSGEPALVRQTKASLARESLLIPSRRSSLAPPSSSGRLGISPADRRASIAGSIESRAPSRARTDDSSAPVRPSPFATTGRPSLSTSTVKTDRGKQVFRRAAVELAEQERKRKEKEEAAKKARAEAGERGRQASKEWAEKQRQKGQKALVAKGLQAVQE